ncbi:VQ motif-containing protein 31 [Spatholobus suberectus]|nr:VQ motif-containing protein 31 [Spatholobus suberectus]
MVRCPLQQSINVRDQREKIIDRQVQLYDLKSQRETGKPVMRMEKPPIHGAASDCKPLTTFVQTNSDAFREVVQRLTGPSEASAAKEGEASKVAIVKRTTSKLHERRKYMKPKLEIVKPTFHYKTTGACLSPSKSRSSSFPPSPGSGSSSLFPSPTTPSTLFSQLNIMEDDKKEESVMPELNTEEEEKAIKERRFYLHPSPRVKAGYTEPELLTLFPVASPNAKEKKEVRISESKPLIEKGVHVSKIFEVVTMPTDGAINKIINCNESKGSATQDKWEWAPSFVKFLPKTRTDKSSMLGPLPDILVRVKWPSRVHTVVHVPVEDSTVTAAPASSAKLQVEELLGMLPRYQSGCRAAGSVVLDVENIVDAFKGVDVVDDGCKGAWRGRVIE